MCMLEGILEHEVRIYHNCAKCIHEGSVFHERCVHWRASNSRLKIASKQLAASCSCVYDTSK